jgi:suppressor of G2 allele of SKP1
MASEAARGQDALKANDYPLAITHLTAALKSSQSPLWLIQRSTAYQRTGKHELALADADNAVLAARSRARRELIATAQFRRAVALHGLKRYGDARMCLNWCMKINEKEKGVTLWMARVKADYEKAEKEGGESAEKNLVMVKEIPDEIKEVGAAEKDLGKKLEETKIAAKSGNIAAAAAAVASAVATPKEKIRTEWYQSGEKVTIEILAKGVPKEQAEISIKEGSVSKSPLYSYPGTH